MKKIKLPKVGQKVRYQEQMFRIKEIKVTPKEKSKSSYDEAVIVADHIDE